MGKGKSCGWKNEGGGSSYLWGYLFVQLFLYLDELGACECEAFARTSEKLRSRCSKLV